MVPDQISPLGVDVADDVQRDLEQSAEYRAEWERQAVAFAIAKAVYVRRTELGLSQEELGDRMGTSGSDISRSRAVATRPASRHSSESPPRSMRTWS